MKPAAQYADALAILDAALKSHKPIDRVMYKHLKNNRYIGSHDRKNISDIVYGIIRAFHRLDWHVTQARVRDKSARTYLIAYLMLALKKPAAELDSLFTGERFAPTQFTHAERAFIKYLSGTQLKPEAMPESTALECPEWLIYPLMHQYGEAFLPLLRALMLPATVDLRVNPLCASREGLLTELNDAGLNVTPTAYSPFGLRVPARFAYNRLEALLDGRLEIQDESSQLCALLLDARAGMAVLDLCAGAGGKTLLLAALMQNKGRLVATDTSEVRLKECERRVKKARIDNVTVRLLDNRWLKQNAAKFDRVLVDAPCTGSGTWRRNPDARLRYGALDMEALQATQREVLSKGAAMVKVGGRLMYSTCSLLAAENDEQAAWFSGEFPNFAPFPLADSVVTQGIQGLHASEGNTLQLMPHEHHTDGFFVSVWERVS